MRHESHRKIHKKLRRHTPEGVKKAKKIFAFKYPKLFFLIVLSILAYYVFTQPFIYKGIELLEQLGYFGLFLSGMMTSVGFTAAFGIGLLIKIDFSNIFLATLITGLGAMVADLIIFKSVKLSFMDEFKRLEKTTLIQDIEKIVNNNKSVLIRHYLLYLFAGIVLATPLPDEFGVSMLAGLTTIKPVKLAIISFLLHSFFIFLILYFV